MTFEVGEVAEWIVGMPGYDTDECTVTADKGDGTYQVKFQVYGRGPWHEGVAHTGIMGINRILKKRKRHV